ncbi:thiosulfate sulfurtransferase [Andreprevotia lacus DSM 23236]|jgi:rhodanese-related sulfurtransferase|uniref:Thiosulfate sulfurtransferase n=1 Tax=Andreprevotia lacus DSM 23236 TaxID=1121001 RepID=A0A1W1XUU9_9NEIS|nr:rhodanese-like domain-containing protein [Andreprevotia lacus]SMC27760.1 thiosulfate sulfurtransferase [Andreprevotia lacus DSM 23236]
MATATLSPVSSPAAQPAAESNLTLDVARHRAAQDNLPFAGSVTPLQAWQLVNSGAGRLVDVRSPEEVKFVGHVPDVLNVPWASGTSLNRNPRFVKELESKAGGKDAVLLLLCRSGKRSAEAAAAAAKAGFSNVFNVLEGFEGELDEQHRRGALGGWRHHGLPWQQD